MQAHARPAGRARRRRRARSARARSTQERASAGVVARSVPRSSARLRDHVRRRAGVHASRRVTTPGSAGSSRRDDDRLQRRDELPPPDDRIGRLVRSRAVRARAVQHDLESCRPTRRAARPGRRPGRPRSGGRRAPPKIAAHAVERAALEHRARPVADLLRRLQHDQHVAGGRARARAAAPRRPPTSRARRGRRRASRPRCTDANVESGRLVIGSASMSPRSATTGARGVAAGDAGDESRARRRAGRRRSRARAGHAPSASCVRVSCHESSGCRCRSRRRSTSAARSALVEELARRSRAQLRASAP